MRTVSEPLRNRASNSLGALSPFQPSIFNAKRFVKETYRATRSNRPCRGKGADYRRTIGEVVYDAQVEVLKAPKDDCFQVITEHPAQDFIFDPSYLGIQRSKDCVFIQLTLNAGRSVDQKRGFYKAIADGLHERLGLRREDVFISLVEVGKENWSFGNGEAQYAK